MAEVKPKGPTDSGQLCQLEQSGAEAAGNQGVRGRWWGTSAEGDGKGCNPRAEWRGEGEA